MSMYAECMRNPDKKVNLDSAEHAAAMKRGEQFVLSFEFHKIETENVCSFDLYAFCTLNVSVNLYSSS